MIKIWLSNLGKYNEGELTGKWFTLPIADTTEALKQIGVEDNTEYEEYAIHDYESNIEGLTISEYENLDSLNELAEEIEKMTEEEQQLIGCYFSLMNNDINEAVASILNGEVYLIHDINTDEQLGEYLMEENGRLDEIPEDLQYYFDYDQYGREFNINNTGAFFDNLGYVYINC